MHETYGRIYRNFDRIIYREIGAPYPSDWAKDDQKHESDPMSQEAALGALRSMGGKKTTAWRESDEEVEGIKTNTLLDSTIGIYAGEISPFDVDEAIPDIVKARQETLKDPDYKALRTRNGEAPIITFEAYKECFRTEDFYLKKHWIKDTNPWNYDPKNDPERLSFISKYENSLKGYKSYLEAVKRSDYLLQNFFFTRRLPVLIPESDFERHTWITGRSGSGKSTLLKNLIWNRIRGHSGRKGTVIIVEPHGDLSQEVSAFPEFYINKQKPLIYIDPFLYGNFPPQFFKHPAINPLELRDKTDENIDILTQELTKVFRDILGSDFSLAMQTLLMHCLPVLIARDGSTLHDLSRFLDDERNRDFILLGQKSKNKQISSFFKNDFHQENYGTTKRSLRMRIANMLGSQILADLIASESTLNIEELIDSEACIIFNLSKGKMGSFASEAFGRFLIASIQMAIMRRANKAKKDRIPVHMFIDEFQNYVTETIGEIATEARKYKLFLTLANQTIGQNMDASLTRDLLSSTGVKFVGQNGVDTLSKMGREIGVSVEDLQGLKVGEFYLKTNSFQSRKIYIPNAVDAHNIYWNYDQKELRQEIINRNSKYYRNRHDLDAYFAKLDGEESQPDNSLSEDIENTKKRTKRKRAVLKPKHDL